MTRRRLVMMLAVVAMAMAVMAPASAGGPTPDKLGEQGWTCFPAGPATPQNTHCLNPNQGGGRAASVMVFSGVDGSFMGTELLRFTSQDLSELPCPKDGGHWHNIGPDTWACHHWKGAPSN